MKRGIDYIGVSVGALLIDEKGKVLLMKRSHQANNEKGKWEAPGGAVEFDEKLENAVRREIVEELGVEIDILKQFPAEDEILSDEKQHWVPTTFLAKIKNGQIPRIMEPKKCDEIGWFSLNNLPSPLSMITTLNLKKYTSRR